MFSISEELKKLPDSPGVYIHRDAFGQIIYVGKAVNLSRRVHQYFQSPKNQPPKVREMVSHIAEFEYITTGTEMEALILECNLIKKHRPKYNILLRDDKTYPYIKVTLNENFPRVVKTRRVVNDGSRYFGPFTDATAVNTMIDVINSAYCLKRCRAVRFPAGHTPCLNYHIKKCRGCCIPGADEASYRRDVDKAMEFLQGKSRELTESLKEEMYKASDAMDYERAAELRDCIEAAAAVTQKQRVVLSHPESLDIIIVTQGLSGAHCVLFTVREGKLSGRESFFLGDPVGETKGELAADFIKQYYYINVDIPKELLVLELPPEASLLEDWLSERRGSRVSVICPERGEKRALMELAKGDVAQMLKDIDERAARQTEKEDAIRAGFEKVFGERASSIHRIESYDISNTGGFDSVGAMVVFYDGMPLKKAYRRFRIRTVDGADDTASLQEILYRRIKRALSGDRSFLPLPDLLLMDGGQGQVNAALSVVRAFKLDILVAGLAKDDKHRTRALIFKEREYPLREMPGLFSYAGAIQEEVHRFAIDYHHGLRQSSLSRSVLDDIPGIGQKRKLALLSYFGSLENIKNADISALSDAPGMNCAAAESVRRYFTDAEKKARINCQELDD